MNDFRFKRALLAGHGKSGSTGKRERGSSDSHDDYPAISLEKSEALAMLAKLEGLPPTKRDAIDPLPEELAKLGDPKAEALTKLCLTLFNLDEFVYVD